MSTKNNAFQSNYKKLAERSEFDLDFIVLSICATIICTLGLDIDSPSIVIGSMLISPILSSFIMIPSTILVKNRKSLFLQFIYLLIEVIFIILISLTVAKFLNVEASSSEIVTRLETSYEYYFLVAIVAGIAGTFIYYWPKLLEFIAGVAIAVAILPPLCIVGITLSSQNWDLAETSIMIAIVNIVGILIGSFFTLLVLRTGS